jgi:hypothetical protein
MTINPQMKKSGHAVGVIVAKSTMKKLKKTCRAKGTFIKGAITEILTHTPIDQLPLSNATWEVDDKSLFVLTNIKFDDYAVQKMNQAMAKLKCTRIELLVGIIQHICELNTQPVKPRYEVIYE